MQTAIAPQTKKTNQKQNRNLQDFMLSHLRRSQMEATFFLMNGFQLRGQIEGFDPFVVIIASNGKQNMVYKHAISTIVPERPLSWENGPDD